jgi:hypothetical protein
VLGEFGTQDPGDNAVNNTDTTAWAAADRAWLGLLARYLKALSWQNGPASWMWWSWNVSAPGLRWFWGGWLASWEGVAGYKVNSGLGALRLAGFGGAGLPRWGRGRQPVLPAAPGPPPTILEPRLPRGGAAAMGPARGSRPTRHYPPTPSPTPTPRQANSADTKGLVGPSTTWREVQWTKVRLLIREYGLVPWYCNYVSPEFCSTVTW